MFGFREFLKNAMRVMTVITKPKTHEFKQIAKITGLGMLLIGIVGYVISYIAYILS